MTPCETLTTCAGAVGVLAALLSPAKAFVSGAAPSATDGACTFSCSGGAAGLAACGDSLCTMSRCVTSGSGSGVVCLVAGLVAEGLGVGALGVPPKRMSLTSEPGDPGSCFCEVCPASGFGVEVAGVEVCDGDETGDPFPLTFRQLRYAAEQASRTTIAT